MHDSLRTETATETQPRNARTLWRKLTLGLLVAATALSAMEGVARLLVPFHGHKRFEQINQIVLFLGTHESDLMLDFDPQRFWKLKPDIVIEDSNNTFWKGQVSNSLGYRCPEFSLEKAPKTIRVVCFGDSSTFGIGARMEDTWPSQLQTMLQSEVPSMSNVELPRYEVINAGVPGYTSYQGLQFMRQEIDRLQPDLVMASYANNDFWHWDQQTDEDHAERLNDTSVVRRVLLKSRLVQLIETGVSRLRPPPVAVASQLAGSPNQPWAEAATYNYVNPVDEWTPRVPLNAFRRNIIQMADLCNDRQLPLILVKWPDQPQAAGQWSPRIAYQQVLDEIAVERGLQVSDVVSLFQDNRSWSVHTYVPNDIVHVNRAGNALAAAAAKDAIQRVELVRSALTN